MSNESLSSSIIKDFIVCSVLPLFEMQDKSSKNDSIVCGDVCVQIEENCLVIQEADSDKTLEITDCIILQNPVFGEGDYIFGEYFDNCSEESEASNWWANLLCISTEDVYEVQHNGYGGFEIIRKIRSNKYDYGIGETIYDGTYALVTPDRIEVMLHST